MNDAFTIGPASLDYCDIYEQATRSDPPTCDCCKRTVERSRGSQWHTGRICSECFIEWYDGDRPIKQQSDLTDALAIGNWVRRRHGLSPLDREKESTS